MRKQCGGKGDDVDDLDREGAFKLTQRFLSLGAGGGKQGQH